MASSDGECMIEGAEVGARDDTLQYERSTTTKTRLSQTSELPGWGVHKMRETSDLCNDHQRRWRVVVSTKNDNGKDIMVA